MVSFLRIETNCPWCLLDTCAELGARPDVEAVNVSMSEQCLEITHHGDLDEMLHRVGARLHTSEVADNAEIVMVASTIEQQATCRRASYRGPGESTCSAVW